MKKRGKRWIITLVIIAVVIVLAVIVLIRSHPDVSDQISKCIGENSVLYVQTGCHACEYQKELFGEGYNNLNIIDCWFERDKCTEIRGTPTWIINSQQYVGARTIDELKELTNC